MDAVTDYGPSVHRDREGKLISTGAGAVVMEDREDISVRLNRQARRPVVRGARRWSTLGALLNDGVIDGHQHAAACRFLDDCSKAQGSSQASFLAIVVSGGAGRVGLTKAQQAALRAVMRVRLLLGLHPDTVFWWVVLDNKTPRDFAEHFGKRPATAYELFKKALIQLDEHYQHMGSRNRDGDTS